MTDQYTYGREKEKRVARKLRGHGASVELMKGSRGPCDLKAGFPGGTVWYVEVKTTRSETSGADDRGAVAAQAIRSAEQGDRRDRACEPEQN